MALASSKPAVSRSDRDRSKSAPPEPLWKFLKRAAVRAAHEIGATSDRYRSPAWLFARCLKTRPELQGLSAEQAVALIDREVDAMYPGSPAPWVALGLPDQDSADAIINPRTDFLGCWEKVTTPLHPGGAVDDAAERADEKPIDLGGRFAHPLDAPVRRLASICYHLAERSPSREFFLSCRDAGRVLEISHTEAIRHLDRLRKAGILEAKPYSTKDRAARQAQGWRFLGIPPAAGA